MRLITAINPASKPISTSATIGKRKSPATPRMNQTSFGIHTRLHGLNRYVHQRGRTYSDPHLMSLIEKYVPAGGAILEAGFHTGNNLIPLAKHRNQYRVYGAELFDPLIERVRSRLSWSSARHRTELAQWSIASPEQCPWPDQQFNAIVAVHVMSHLTAEQLENSIQGLIPRLKPGGVLIMTLLRSGNITFDSENDDYVTGTIFHSDAHIAQATEGLNFLRTDSILYDEQLAKHWNLSPKALQWLVFQKPEEPVPAEHSAKK